MYLIVSGMYRIHVVKGDLVQLPNVLPTRYVHMRGFVEDQQNQHTRIE